MRKHFPILAIIAISSILRIWNLGNIPSGLSLQEVGLGMFFQTAFLVRLPFVAMGIATIYVLYLISRKIFDDEKLALISAFLLGIIPWHVAESRVFSWGVVLLLSGEITAFLMLKVLDKKTIRLPKFNLYLAILLALICIIVPSKDLATRVNDQRLIVTSNSPKIVSRVFINKVTENYRLRQQILFTNIDFGNYFFAGHPRERGGIEETQKLLLFILPFIISGLFKIGNKEGKPLVTWTVISLFVLTFFNWQGSQSLILILPFIFLTSLGILESLKTKNILLKGLVFLLFTFGLFESLYFYNSYFSGYTESQFSPRRPIYIELSKKITEVKRNGENVLVNDRIGNPKDFLNFYLNSNIGDYEFRTFDYHKESETGKLFVDILPDDPISNEPLYTKNGTWPDNLNILGVLYDTGRRQKVVIYRTK